MRSHTDQLFLLGFAAAGGVSSEITINTVQTVNPESSDVINPHPDVDL